MHLLLLSVVLQWGLAFVALKILVEDASALTIVTIRFVFTSAAFLVLMAFWPGARARIEPADRGRIAVMALAGVAGYHLAVTYGERSVSAGVASLIIAAMPVMVAILSARFLRERITSTKRLGIGMALGGVVVLTLLGSTGATLQISHVGGALVTVLAPVCWSIYTVLGKPLVGKYGALPVTAITMTVGTVVLLPVGIPATIRGMGGLTAGDWGWLAFLAFGCTVFAYVVWNVGLSRLEASSTAVWVYLVPLFSLTWAWLLLDERLTLWVVLGGALVLGGVILTERVAPRLAARGLTPEPEAA